MKDLSEVKPGDFVRLIGLPASRLQVVELITSTCPGGTQYAVACRCFDARREFSTTLQRFNVIEVEAVPPEAVPPEDALPSLTELITTAKEAAICAGRFDIADMLRLAQRRSKQALEQQAAADTLSE